jgi:hypothetical protein
MARTWQRRRLAVSCRKADDEDEGDQLCWVAEQVATRRTLGEGALQVEVDGVLGERQLLHLAGVPLSGAATARSHSRRGLLAQRTSVLAVAALLRLTQMVCARPRTSRYSGDADKQLVRKGAHGRGLALLVGMKKNLRCAARRHITSADSGHILPTARRHMLVDYLHEKSFPGGRSSA